MKLIRGKIPVKVNPLFWLLILFIGVIQGSTIPQIAIWMGVVLFSVLVHEYGHALTAVSFGHRAHIELIALGGVTHRRGPPLKLWQDFIIVLNGPLAGFALSVIAYQLYAFFESTNVNIHLLYALQVTYAVNLFWTFVNLLPINPLDGGHLLRIFLEGVFGHRGIKIALFSSFFLAALISVFFLVRGAFLIGILFILLMFENFRGWRAVYELSAQDRNWDLQSRFKEAEREIQFNRDSEEVLSKFSEIREEAKEGMIYMAATEYMAQILATQGKHKIAYDLLIPHKKQLNPETLPFLHNLAFKLGHFDEAIYIGNLSFQYVPNYETAVINALCHSIIGQAKPAVGWLQTAINEGLPNLREILEKREFDHIRDLPEFQNLLGK